MKRELIGEEQVPVGTTMQEEEELEEEEAVFVVVVLMVFLRLWNVLCNNF